MRRELAKKTESHPQAGMEASAISRGRGHDILPVIEVTADLNTVQQCFRYSERRPKNTGQASCVHVGFWALNFLFKYPLVPPPAIPSRRLTTDSVVNGAGRLDTCGAFFELI